MKKTHRKVKQTERNCGLKCIIPYNYITIFVDFFLLHLNLPLFYIFKFIINSVRINSIQKPGKHGNIFNFMLYSVLPEVNHL